MSALGDGLALLGKIDGAIAAAAASWGLYDPAHVKIAICIAGIAGGVGMILNGISHYLGGADVVVITPSPVIREKAESTVLPPEAT